MSTYVTKNSYKKDILRWFGLVECEDDADWIICCAVMEVDGNRNSGLQVRFLLHPVEYVMLFMTESVTERSVQDEATVQTNDIVSDRSDCH